MKIKILWNVVLAALVVPLLTGCMCSMAISEKCDERTVDVLNPSAVYRQAGPTNSFALEGMITNPFSHDETSFHAYVYLPDYLFFYDHLQGNDTLSYGDLKKIQDRKAENFPEQELETTGKLPSSYQKIADLPKNDLSLQVKEHHPKAYLALLLPFAMVIDVATFPYQFVYLLYHQGC